MTTNQKQYAERDARELDRAGNHFSRHMLAMTTEDLRGKAEIAAELAHRDAEIESLRTELAAHEESKESVALLVRELDVMLNGEEGAASQASLCDIVAQLRKGGPAALKQAQGEPVAVADDDADCGISWITNPPHGTGLYTAPQPATAIDASHYVIWFDDADRKPEMYNDKTAALTRYGQISVSWNAHLFALIDSNACDAGTVPAKQPMLVVVPSLAQALRIRRPDCGDTVEIQFANPQAALDFVVALAAQLEPKS